MHLKDDWKLILRRAWSVRLILLAGLLSGCEVVLPLFVADIPRNVFAALSIVATTAALVARLVAQRGL